MLLAFFRLIGKIFFREIVIEGREHLPPSGPVILTPNHPNDLLDPLLTLFFSPPYRLRHIAKTTLFLVPLVGSILRRMRAIPVLRHKEAHGPIDYTSFFDECVEALAQGDSIVIFPEGGSSENPSLGHLKTGVARMYFLARERGIDVPIVPVGINYEEGSIFRSSVLLLVARPVDTSRAMALYASDPTAAIHALTAEIEAVLSDHVFQAETFQDRELIILLERVYFESQQEHPWAERYKRLAEFKPRVTDLRQCCPGEMRRLRKLAARYRRLSRIAGTRTGETPATPVTSILGTMGSLIAYIGWAFNWIPYRLVRWLVERGRLPRMDIATMTIRWSLLIFPLAYLVEGLLIAGLFGWKEGLLFGIGIGPFSYLALRYFEWRETLGIRPSSPPALFSGRWSRRTARRLNHLREQIMREVAGFPASPRK
ncbi:MAG TPA: 1-acyl-sn-glycerol-3-phosphate acyltransferase [Syntrophales bacterium]|nr:1-acyl-sn-glycerol-3-phosphate acyltransferase [Syntrophales bacterium]